ncbi:hypothetical protein LZ31DRAFT_590394 [Colletotrichum somersetense]|nr:hypothetical protein LZ31DRAFT_590394 [Colletotrichum somersetense]
MYTDNSERLDTFVVGFLTNPKGISEISSSNFRGVLLLATLFILGFGWLFALLETLVTMRCGPLHIVSFTFMRIVLVSYFVSIVMLHWLNVFVAEQKDTEGDCPILPEHHPFEGQSSRYAG